jgi:hypothetical protein
MVNDFGCNIEDNISRILLAMNQARHAPNKIQAFTISHCSISEESIYSDFANLRICQSSYTPVPAKLHSSLVTLPWSMHVNIRCKLTPSVNVRSRQASKSTANTYKNILIFIIQN